MLFYRAALPLSPRTLNFVAGVIRRHRRPIGSTWRKLLPGRQVLLVLAYLKEGETFAQLAAGFDVGLATVWRYVDEVVELLAARAPKLRQAVRDAKRAGHAYVILDGTLIPIDRVARDRPFYSGKHKKHGMNLQVIAGPAGNALWVSGALPGSVHDEKAEWTWGAIDELERHGLVVLADKGYRGSAWAKVPYKGKNKPEPSDDGGLEEFRKFVFTCADGASICARITVTCSCSRAITTPRSSSSARSRAFAALSPAVSSEPRASRARAALHHDPVSPANRRASNLLKRTRTRRQQEERPRRPI